MSDDPFSDILKVAQAQSVVSGGLTAGGQWAIRFPVTDQMKLIGIVKGSCWLCIDGEVAPVRVEAGDVFLLSARRSVVLAGDLATVPVDAKTVFTPNAGLIAKLGDGDDCFVIGGHVLLDAVSGGLLADVLPALIHVRVASPQATVLQWLLDQLVRERAADLPGTSLVSAQLAQLMFVQIFACTSRNNRVVSSRMASGGRRQAARSRSTIDAQRSRASVAASGTRQGGRNVPDDLRLALQVGGRDSSSRLLDNVADAPRREGSAGGEHPGFKARAVARLRVRKRFQQCFQAHHWHCTQTLSGSLSDRRASPACSNLSCGNASSSSHRRTVDRAAGRLAFGHIGRGGSITPSRHRALPSDRISQQGLHPQGVVDATLPPKAQPLGRPDDQVEISAGLVDVGCPVVLCVHDKVVCGKCVAALFFPPLHSRQEMAVGRLRVDVGVTRRHHSVAQHGGVLATDHWSRQVVVFVLLGNDLVQALLGEQLRPSSRSLSMMATYRS